MKFIQLALALSGVALAIAQCGQTGVGGACGSATSIIPNCGVKLSFRASFRQYNN
jgi:hypothetical protein